MTGNRWTSLMYLQVRTGKPVSGVGEIRVRGSVGTLFGDLRATWASKPFMPLVNRFTKKGKK